MTHALMVGLMSVTALRFNFAYFRSHQSDWGAKCGNVVLTECGLRYEKCSNFVIQVLKVQVLRSSGLCVPAWQKLIFQGPRSFSSIPHRHASSTRTQHQDAAPARQHQHGSTAARQHQQASTSRPAPAGQHGSTSRPARQHQQASTTAPARQAPAPAARQHQQVSTSTSTSTSGTSTAAPGQQRALITMRSAAVACHWCASTDSKASSSPVVGIMAT